MNKIPEAISRRNFLGGAAAFSGATMFSSMLSMSHFASTAAAVDGGDDYKALVCVLLGGGNDSYNMLIPTAIDEYAAYASARGNLALVPEIEPGEPNGYRRGPYHPLALGPSSPNSIDAQGMARSFALHPALPEIQGLFDSGDVGFIANVGTLSEPVTKAEYQAAAAGSGDKQVPRALFSHSDQTTQWQTARPNRSVNDGWAGRFPSGLAREADAAGQIPMHISVRSNPIWQAGPGEATYVISSDGSTSYLGHDDPDGASAERIRFEALVGGSLSGFPVESSFVGQSPTNVFKAHYLDEVKRTTALHGEFSDAFDPAYAEVLPDSGNNDLAARLRAIVASIKARESLGLRRQVFFVRQAGTYDHHSQQLLKHHDMLTQLDEALAYFNEAIKEIDMHEQVVTFTTSEFGRALVPAGTGTSHGWGGHQIVMGGPVRGAAIHGKYPEDLTPGGPADIDNQGRTLPTTSVDAYGGELARWFGVAESDLPSVFPNAHRFFDVSEPHPVGFLGVPATFSPPTQSAAENVVVTSSCGYTGSEISVSVTNDQTTGAYYIWWQPFPEPIVQYLEAGETQSRTVTSLPDGTHTVLVARSNQSSVSIDVVVGCG